MMTRMIGLWQETGRLAKRFAADERAATAIEYAIIAAGVGAAVAATVWSVGSAVKSTLYGKVDNALD